MKVRELQEKLGRLDPELDVACCVEDAMDLASGTFSIGVLNWIMELHLDDVIARFGEYADGIGMDRFGQSGGSGWRITRTWLVWTRIFTEQQVWASGALFLVAPFPTTVGRCPRYSRPLGLREGRGSRARPWRSVARTPRRLHGFCHAPT